MIHRDTLDQDKIHRAKVIAKVQKIQGLRALLEMHEANPDHDHDYVVGLRARLRSVENQLTAMRP
jgi:hypothetical protein